MDRPKSNTQKEKKTPTHLELKWFGILLMPFFIALYFLLSVKFDSPKLGYSLLGVGGTMSLFYLALPKYRSLIYRLWVGLFYPIGWIVSHLVMTLLYYVVFTPVGLLMRATGHDPLTRSFDSGMKSYWFERDESCELDKKRSLKQF
ncbi:MAG: SxtJ family membrane protein [Verrucomicrobiota bacterium]|nr:SxtJ family membrane protein [Verrucomicrobiota bacterium]